MGCRKCIVEFLPVLLVTFLLARVGFHDAASAAEPEPALIVRNVEGRETKLTLSELAKLSRVTVRAKDEKGSEEVWEGIALHEVLKAAGMNLGEATRGAALANYLIAEAADGYRVVFALPEVDPAFTDFIFFLRIAAMRSQWVSTRDGGVLSYPMKRDTRGGYEKWQV